MNYLLASKITQVVVTLLLILLILIQSREAGLAAGIKSSFSMYRSRRGVEKLVFYMTILLSAVLVVNSLLIVVLG